MVLYQLFTHMKYCCGVVQIALKEDVRWPDDDVLLNLGHSGAHVSMNMQPKAVA